MNLASLSIKRPVFISCIFISMLVVGFLSLKRLPVDLFPNISFPVVVVSTPYPGAGPKEIETLISKPLEEEVSTISGIKTVRSTNLEGLSQVIAEFSLETDVKVAEQQIRDRVSSAKPKLPKDIREPNIRRVDPADQPIIILSITADLAPGALYDLAHESLRPKFEQIPQVGLVEVVGGRKREIHVELDRNKLKAHEISATQVVSRIRATGQDIPVGKVTQKDTDLVFRALGEFRTIKEIEDTVVSFLGNDVPVTVRDVGVVKESLEDEKSRTFVNGNQALSIMIFRQSGANTIAVVDAIRAKLTKLNETLESAPGKPKLEIVQDQSKFIRENVMDVKESITIGIILTIVVVFLFLGSLRSTLITGVALPNSLLGAFILMAVAGFTVNVMTLLAMSLAVGLLIDDAIVVRENIFRYLEKGISPKKAAEDGTNEVALAVIATTLTVIAVFGPIAFLKGVVGQFFKEFGLTICFAMLISLFDAFTMAPMLSAYMAGKHGAAESNKTNRSMWTRFMDRLLGAFERFQVRLENYYEVVLKFSLKRPLVVLLSAVVIFVVSLLAAGRVPKTFLPAQDYGEFSVSLELAPGTSIQRMSEVAHQVDQLIRKNKEVHLSYLAIGGRNASTNTATFFVDLVPHKQRSVNTSQFKERLREQLKEFSYANPVVKDVDAVGGGQRPFNVNITGNNLEELEVVAKQVFEKIKNHPALLDPEISYKPGKPELQIILDNRKAERLGISSAGMGLELRTLIEGDTPAVFREGGLEYDIRVRLQENQRNLKNTFNDVYIPNINYSLIRLANVAKANETTGPANINRQDRGRYIQLAGDIAPDGPGMGGLITDIKKIMSSEIKLPPGMSYSFVGQAENFQELVGSMITAMGLGILFIYLVLASLYESFVIPLTIMLVLPLAAVGAFFALLITGKSLDLFSMIGCVMLMGIATKNSILLVDYANQLVNEGKTRYDAMLAAGRTRLRPILMTTLALIVGMIPVAIGLNEASRQRVSMGIAVIGGLISSTLLTLIVVPAAYDYIDRFRVRSKALLVKWFT